MIAFPRARKSPRITPAHPPYKPMPPIRVSGRVIYWLGVQVQKRRFWFFTSWSEWSRCERCKGRLFEGESSIRIWVRDGGTRLLCLVFFGWDCSMNEWGSICWDFVWVYLLKKMHSHTHSLTHSSPSLVSFQSNSLKQVEFKDWKCFLLKSRCFVW